MNICVIKSEDESEITIDDSNINSASLVKDLIVRSAEDFGNETNSYNYARQLQRNSTISDYDQSGKEIKRRLLEQIHSTRIGNNKVEEKQRQIILDKYTPLSIIPEEDIKCHYDFRNKVVKCELCDTCKSKVRIERKRNSNSSEEFVFSTLNRARPGFTPTIQEYTKSKIIDVDDRMKRGTHRNTKRFADKYEAFKRKMREMKQKEEQEESD